MSEGNAGPGSDRRQFLGKAAAGVGTVVGVTSLQALMPSLAVAKAPMPEKSIPSPRTSSS